MAKRMLVQVGDCVKPVSLDEPITEELVRQVCWFYGCMWQLFACFVNLGIVSLLCSACSASL